jgi:hypothetical protein
MPEGFVAALKVSLPRHRPWENLHLANYEQRKEKASQKAYCGEPRKSGAWMEGRRNSACATEL